MYDYNATTPPIKILLDRVAELEDKIENGTLVPKYDEYESEDEAHYINSKR